MNDMYLRNCVLFMSEKREREIYITGRRPNMQISKEYTATIHGDRIDSTLSVTGRNKVLFTNLGLLEQFP